MENNCLLSLFSNTNTKYNTKNRSLTTNLSFEPKIFKSILKTFEYKISAKLRGNYKKENTNESIESLNNRTINNLINHLK